MAYAPVTVTKFGGLRLDADPGDLGFSGATSLSNVELDLNGTTRSRPGFDRVDSNTLTSPIWLLRSRSQGQYVLVGEQGGATNLRAYNGSTLVSANTGAAAGGATHAVEIGGPALGYVVQTITGTCSLGLYSAGVLTGTAIGPASPKFLSVWQGRLVMAQTSVANAGAVTTRDPSVIRFSLPGGGFLGNDNADYLFLDLNDGQQIRMVVTWRDLLFAFKETRFYVFYSTSTDVTGGAIFNYRTVDSGVGCGYDYAACVAQDGVYFVHQDGIYRTTGGVPELVSQALQPFFDQRSNGIFSPTGPLSFPRIHAGDDRLYVWQQGSTGMFVMDLRSREWTYWVLGVAPYALLPLPDPREVIFTNSTGQLYKLSPDYTDDDGVAIPSSYQSGFQTIADGASARLRRFELTGTGTVNHATASDLGAVGTSASVAMGTSVAKAYDLRAARARDLSWKVSATSGAWTLSRWAGLIADARHR